MPTYVERDHILFVDNFDRAQVYSTTPGHNGWTIKDTSSGGTPTYLNVTEDGGAAKLTLDNTSEAQIVTLFQNDVLMLDLATLQTFEAVVKVAGIDAVTTLVVGLASAQNDTPDTVAVNAWFRLQGSASLTAIVVETDDGTTDNDDKATGKSFGSGYHNLKIDFTCSVAAATPAALKNIKFIVDGQRVAETVTFDMSAISAGQNVQPFIQLQKASGTGTPSVTIAKIAYQLSYAYSN